MLRPEQARALDYLRRKGTEAPVDRLHEHLAGTFRDIEALLDTVPPELRSAAPSPGRWSVHEIVDHLVESHRPAVEQLRCLVAGRRPPGEPIPASLQSPSPFDRTWEELVSELRAIHRSFLALTGGAAGDVSLDITAPVVMVVKAATEDGGTAPVAWEEELDWKAFVQAFRVHTVEHRAQILRTLGELGGVS